MPTLLKSHYTSRISLFVALIIIILTPLFTSSAEPIQAAATAPTDADIFRSQGFEEPLVPIGGKTTAPENAALRSAIVTYSKRTDRDDHSAIIRFVSDYPKSPWNAALLTNLGLRVPKGRLVLKGAECLGKSLGIGQK